MPEVAERQHADTESQALRFWSKVDRRDAKECWLWTAGVGRSGYGLFWDGEKVRTASRMAYLFAKGDPGNLQVHHTCDNPLCCNPDHLWAGSQLENMRDMLSKGRHRHVNKFGLQLLREIRDCHRSGESIASLSRRFGVSVRTIQSFVR